MIFLGLAIPENLLYFKNVPIKCSKYFFYYNEFIYRRACEKNSSLSFMSGWFLGLKDLDVFFGKSTAEQVLKSFLGRNNSLKPPFLDL